MLAGSIIALQNSWVQTRVSQRVAAILSNQLGADISIGKVYFSFWGKLELEDILVRDQAKDTLIYAHSMIAGIDTLKLRQHLLTINNLEFNDNKIKVSRDSLNKFNFDFLFEGLSSTAKDSTGNWVIRCNTFAFNNLNFDYNEYYTETGNNFNINNIKLEVNDFSSEKETTRFKIKHLELNKDNILVLENISTDVKITPEQIDIINCNIESRLSSIENSSVKLVLPNKQDSLQTPLNIDVQVGASHISFRELGKIIPSMAGMDQTVDLSGQVYGTFDDLKGKNILIQTGQETKAHLDFYINNPGDPDNMYLFLDLKELQTSFSDLSNIRFPDSSPSPYLEFPEGFTRSGLLKFKGNFSGFLTDFVTFGTLNSDMGSMSTDMLVAPEKDGSVHYRGNLSTNDFDLGLLFRNESLGKLTFSGSANGNYDFDRDKVYGVMKGDIKKIDINKYTYRDISFDGILLDKMFDGVLAINDSNLQFSFIGEVNLNPEIPEFDFLVQLDKARLGNLNLSNKFPNAEVAFNMNANFKGNRLDNMDGQIKIDKGHYKNRNGEIDLGGLLLKTDRKKEVSTLNFNSPLVDLEINGTYHFTTILNAFEQTLKRFVPSVEVSGPDLTLQNKFNYKLTIKDINPLAQVLAPGIQFDTPFLLYGKIDSKDKNFELEGSIPGIRYNSMQARDVFIGNKIVGNHYASKFRFSELQLNPNMKLYNFKIDSKIADNKIDNSISWSNYNKLTYSGEILTHADFSRSDTSDHAHIIIDGSPSKIIIADTAWYLSPFKVTIDTSSISVQNFKIRNNDQLFAVEGNIRKGQANMLKMELKNFRLEHLDTYLHKKLELSGTVNGTFGVSNLLDKPAIISDLTIGQLSYQDLLVGDVFLNSQWNGNQSVIDSKLKLTSQGKTSLNAFGTYEPSSGAMNFDASLDSVPLVVLETFIGGSITNFQGYGSGKMNISGTTAKILMNGVLMGAGAGLTIDATQVPYTFNDSVYFRNDTILFDHITVFDQDKNTGIFNGTITHDNFANTRYNLHLTTDKILALNTSSVDNEKFYGVAVARGKLDITGKSQSILLSGSVTSLKGTDLNISMENESEAEQYDFIEFARDTNQTENKSYLPVEDETGNVHIIFTVEATSDAKVQLIYNSQIGDIIKAQGEGILVFEMTEEGDILLSGNYNPTKGDYLFTLRNVINKRFSIEPGGSIVWSGDPYNAVIDLKAIYKLKASLYDLFTDVDNYSQTQRVQVECIIHLEDELINPKISFEINVPNTDEQTKDRLMQFFSTEDELNKQILSLIVMGKFYTPEYKRGTFEAQNTNMLGTTASELFSNQLSNWLSKISDNWDVGVNYRPGNDITDDEIELALSTQMFNDRVTLNGNIGNNVNQYSTNSSQIVGDFEINVKLVPSGKLQFKAYNRSNNNLIYETAPYTQGVGISVTEEYNTFQGLLHKIGNLFKRKNKKTAKTGSDTSASR